ncbi:hypothetical protein PG996_011832 [Apiospora saccharicola]|uniref:Uncharacterized protein n=1 Tax=Apiospora saccharicola TaxID=335842 RepID=A0ABR1UG63_9PEZI
MLFSHSSLAALLVAAGCLASPIAPLEVSVLRSDQTDALVQKGVDLAHTSPLERRLKADFSMARSWNHEVLFSGYVPAPSASHDVDHLKEEEGAAESETVGLNITCIDCETRGNIEAKLWEDLLHPSLRLNFNNVEAYILLGLNASASTTVSVNLFASNSPIGLHYPGLSVGVVFFVDLVFSLNAHIDMSGGFYIKLADDAFLEASIFKGDVSKYFFDGASSKSLPITVATGSGATFKADLRLRVQVGAEAAVDTFGIGAGAAMGIYANLVEFVAEIEKTPTCELETREWFDLNAGAYARLDVVVDYKTLGLVPTVSTTLLSAPTLTQCWIQGTASGLPGPGKTITASTLSMTAPPGWTMSASAIPMVSSSSASLAKQSSSGRVTVSASASGSSRVASSSSTASISTRTISIADGSSSSSSASISAKYAVSSAKESSPLSSAVPSLAPPLSLNGTGRYPIVHNSQVSVSGSQTASSSSSRPSSSVSGIPKSLSTHASSVSTSFLPAAASVTAKYPASITTISPFLAPGNLSVVIPPPSVNSTGRYPLLNVSSLTNETNLVTTTLYSTSAYTITMCAAGVPNCPAAYQKEVTVTKTVDSYTTVCPAGAQVTWPAAKEVGGEAASSSSAAAAGGPVTSTRVITQVVVMTAVPSPTPETFVPPPVPAPTAAAHVAAAANGESGPAPTSPRPAAAAAYAAFMADYGVENAGPRNATLATPSSSSSSSSSPSPSSSSSPSPSSSSSSSSSGSNQPGYPVAPVNGAGQSGESAASLAESFDHKTIAEDTPTSPEVQRPNAPVVTAGAIASYAENIGLVLGSVMVTVLLMG